LLREQDSIIRKSSEIEDHELYSTASPYLIENYCGLDFEVHTLFGSKQTYDLWNSQKCKVSIAEKQIKSDFIIYEDSNLDYTEM